MVKLEEFKVYSEHKPIERLPAPAKVYIPLHQHIGRACLPLVAAGDSVFLGQRIAEVAAHVYAPVHASVSGKVAAIQEWPHPVLGRAKTVVIENDFKDRAQDIKLREQGVADNLTPEQIRNIVFESGIVGMGGAGFPTHIKLNPQNPVDTLIINAAECEPFLTGDFRLMVEKAEEIIKGIKIIVLCLGVKNVIIAIEDNKPEAIKIFSCRPQATSYKLQILKSQYPQGGEKQLIKSVLKKELPRGKLPFEIGVVVQNVSTVYAIYEAVYLGKPLYERVVTVSGSCIPNPKNLLVRVGTPVKELIDFCGPVTEEAAKIITGGPMMGITQHTDQVPVIKSTTGVLLFSAKDARFLNEEFCIRCGACVRECPVNLMPTMINLSSQKELWQEAKKYGALDCIECGICSYVCPSNIRLVPSIKRAKMELLK